MLCYEIQNFTNTQLKNAYTHNSACYVPFLQRYFISPAITADMSLTVSVSKVAKSSVNPDSMERRIQNVIKIKQKKMKLHIMLLHLDQTSMLHKRQESGGKVDKMWNAHFLAYDMIYLPLLHSLRQEIVKLQNYRQQWVQNSGVTEINISSLDSRLS